MSLREGVAMMYEISTSKLWDLSRYGSKDKVINWDLTDVENVKQAYPSLLSSPHESLDHRNISPVQATRVCHQLIVNANGKTYGEVPIEQLAFFCALSEPYKDREEAELIRDFDWLREREYGEVTVGNAYHRPECMVEDLCLELCDDGLVGPIVARNHLEHLGLLQRTPASEQRYVFHSLHWYAIKVHHDSWTSLLGAKIREKLVNCKDKQEREVVYYTNTECFKGIENQEQIDYLLKDPITGIESIPLSITCAEGFTTGKVWDLCEKAETLYCCLMDQYLVPEPIKEFILGGWDPARVYSKTQEIAASLKDLYNVDVLAAVSSIWKLCARLSNGVLVNKGKVSELDTQMLIRNGKKILSLSESV